MSAALPKTLALRPGLYFDKHLNFKQYLSFKADRGLHEDFTAVGATDAPGPIGSFSPSGAKRKDVCWPPAAVGWGRTGREIRACIRRVEGQTNGVASRCVDQPCCEAAAASSRSVAARSRASVFVGTPARPPWTRQESEATATANLTIRTRSYPRDRPRANAA